MESNVTPEQASQLAEDLISNFIRDTGCTSYEDVAHVLEMLISKSACAIEQTVNYDEAIRVIARTINAIPINSQPSKHSIN